MAIFTSEQIASLKDAYTAALLAIAKNQTYEMDGRKFTKANLKEVQDFLTWLDGLEGSAAGRSGPQFVVGRPGRGTNQ